MEKLLIQGSFPSLEQTAEWLGMPDAEVASVRRIAREVREQESEHLRKTETNGVKRTLKKRTAEQAAA